MFRNHKYETDPALGSTTDEASEVGYANLARTEDRFEQDDLNRAALHES